MRVRADTTAHGREGFVAFGQMPVGVQVISAILHIVIRDAKSGARNLTASRVSTSWGAKKLSWSNRPTVVATNAATTALGTVTAFTEVVFNVTAMVQDAANGSAFYGFRISSDADTAPAESICSADAGREERRPWLELIYSTAPAPPTDLSPVDGQYVAVAKPVLAWSFGDPARPNSVQTAVQVQIANDDQFTVSLFDSGKVTLATQQLDTATTAYAGAAADSTRYWRVKVWNDDDVASAYSDVASFMFHALGTVTITNPPVGGVVNDATPPIAWTVASMTQQAFRVLVERLGTAGVWVTQADSERQVSTATSWTIPDAAALNETVTYRVTVFVWDNLARQPGVASYATAQRSPMTYARVAGTTAPAGLAAVASGSLVTLTWTRASAPDYWTVVVDGVIVMPRIDGASLLVSGTNYSLSYWRADPRVSHIYEVQAVVNSAGVLKASTSNPTVTFANDPIGITLVDELTNTAAWIAGQDSWGAEIAEVSNVYMPVGGRSPTLATSVVRGYEGQVTGIIVGSPSIPGVTNPGVDAQTARSAFLSLRTPGRSLRLIIGDRNIPVKVYELSAIPEPTPGDRKFRASFSFFQTDEFDIAWGA